MKILGARASLAFVALLVNVALLGTSAFAADAAHPLLVYGAASLTNVLDELGAAYTRDSGHAIKFSYASSSVLARQIEAGASADVFISADGEWMDYVESRNLMQPKTRSNLLTNRLVLIAPSDSAIDLKIEPGFDLRGALGHGRLSMGDPDSVPAGKYARSALTTLGVWKQISDRIVRADNVRTALAFVDRGECPLGIVYETDALIDKKVKVVDRFAASTHSPIVYPIAATASAQAGAADFIAYLKGASARDVFTKYGFGLAQ
jgi:molybdate transport system substrate-binding protein